MNNIVVYNDGELEIKASVNSETIWLTQKQLGELFEVMKQNISLHINRIFQDNELVKESTLKQAHSEGRALRHEYKPSLSKRACYSTCQELFGMWK